ncbi:FeoB-associated Cys-rich membrane protein [Patescibacteria group bacterium]|nr:FeoB-associated Cys-rich membrane protein [Patescibacteria group bacterium]
MNTISFGTILVAVVTPLLLLVIAYLIVKMTKQKK